MAKVNKVKEALKVQQSIEGYTPETALLLKVLPNVETASQWRALTTVDHHSYGKLSYETHIFYYPSSLLKKIIEIGGEYHFTLSQL